MRNIAVTLSKLFVLCEYFLAAYNSRHASLRAFELLRDFLHENHYLGGKNSARFIPQRGMAAKR
jgi:hypothetical protein